MPSIKTPVELGAVIRDARERHDWTQADLARTLVVLMDGAVLGRVHYDRSKRVRLL